MSVTTLRKKARKAARKATSEVRAEDRTVEDRVEAAAAEARRRFEEVRAAIAARAEDLAEAAEDQWEHARDAAAPKVKELRKRAADVWDHDVADLRRSVIGLGVDVRDASRAEADRVIRAIQESAEQARLEVREAERRRRVRALVGWTAFGMVAGAILALQFGPRSRADEVAADPIEPLSDDPAGDGAPSDEVGGTPQA
jgi:hypothetical protein